MSIHLQPLVIPHLCHACQNTKLLCDKRTPECNICNENLGLSNNKKIQQIEAS